MRSRLRRKVREFGSGSRLLIVALFMTGVLELLVLWRYSVPSVRPLSAAGEEFSAARAVAVLDGILGEQAPHPVGSAQNELVRRRIVDKLSALGHDPELQSEYRCGLWGGRCGDVVNIIVRVPGTSPHSVLLVSHYDSVAAGPGAADDGAGVAALLEIARAIKADPAPHNSLVFLFDDGEERGLLGATLFLRHPLAKSVRVAINLEARGTSGPSLMFETIGHNAWLVDAMAASVERPVTSSLLPAVYERLPNDTDLSVFRYRIPGGYNFAFIEDGRFYHTHQDKLAHLDPGSVQHHGDNALSLTRQLAALDLANLPTGDAVFFDVLSGLIVRWPVEWTVPITVVVTLVFGAAIALLVRARRVSTARLLGAVAAWPLALIVAALAGATLGELLQVTGAIQDIWVERPAPALLAIYLSGFACVATAGTWVGPSSGSVNAGLLASLGTWLVLSWLLAWVLPEASFLVLVPTAAAAVCLLAASLTRSHRQSFDYCTLVGAAVAALLWLPVLDMLYPAIGFILPSALSSVAAFAAAPLLSAFAEQSGRHRWLCAGAAWGLTLLFAAIGAGVSR
jgi:hypothetical protein